MEKLFDLVTEETTLGTIGFAASGCSLPTGESGINVNKTFFFEKAPEWIEPLRTPNFSPATCLQKTG